MEKLKALLHIDESDKWPLVLRNAKNFIEDVGSEHVSLEIVANGAAVQIFALMDKEIDQEMSGLFVQIQQLFHSHVHIVACRNALRANSIQEGLLPDFVTVVPAGITRIVTKQMDGYSYIKP